MSIIADIFANYYQYFLRGTRTTIVVSLVTVFFGTVVGCLIALLRLSKFKPLSGFAKLYVTVLRGTPLLVQLYIVYYQLNFIPYPDGTFLGVELARVIPCIIALSLNSGAYVAEIIRAGIQAVDFGQTEAALSCGMTFGQSMRYIILPQAVKNILPAIGNEFVTMVKETSIIQYLGISDLMYNNGIVVTSTYNPLPCYYISALIYLTLNVVLGKGLNIFEMRLKQSER
ncbi:MAG: amino acid ABC transporter permease [Firmicutes bacterium]|jgi:His/Glu/Gln/Arg/opine family amino acid ABC transporter permease subunit|nr:amino acid ABC transporter permease [Bacillota bacterium]